MRKKTRTFAQVKRTDTTVVHSAEFDSENESLDCIITCSLQQTGFLNLSYRIHDIKNFLMQTRHARNVQTDDFFSDVDKFIVKTRSFMAERGFTDPEVSHLKKIND